MIELNYRDSRPIYEQLKDAIRKMIISGAMFSGEKLPSIREFSTRLAINPNTVARVYRELEIEGYLCSVNGKGTFVSEKINGKEIRMMELLHKFDDLTKELLYLSVSQEELQERVARVGKGGGCL